MIDLVKTNIRCSKCRGRVVKATVRNEEFLRCEMCHRAVKLMDDHFPHNHNKEKE